MGARKAKGAPMNLEGRVALITGAGGDIGAAIARKFVAEGAQICITDLRTDSLEKVACLLPRGSARACQGDVSILSDVEKIVDATVDFGGRLDILVNNAAIDAQGDVVTMDPEEWHKVHDVNLTGPFLTSRVCIPKMIEAGGGSIVNVASLGGLRAFPGMPAYSASKGGLIMLTKQMAVDFGRFNVRSNAVCPGAVHGGMLKTGLTEAAHIMGWEVEDLYERMTSCVPLRRAAHPEEIAAVCAFLASNEASFVTGHALVVDGGCAAVDPMGIVAEEIGLAVH
jgi:meso-butanediol dehydrogenase/(S,S)-butanediol dehydrogenase/diacetyl reductase